MQYMMDDEVISDLKKSSESDRSGYSESEDSDKSFTLQKQYKREEERSSSNKKYKRNQQQNIERNISNVIQPKNDSSSLRMFLEELKNEDNNHQSNRQLFSGKQTYNDQSQKYSPSQTSMASSANIEIIKIQEESFSKIHHDIASLQNKIKGLESRLGPKTLNQQQRTQESEVFQERQLQSGRRFEEESRIMRYRNPNQGLQQKQAQTYNQEQRFIEDKYHTQKDNKENQYKHTQDQVSILTSESDTITYQTFPLRLKKQFQQQQQDIENQRVQLNERFNSQLLPSQKQQVKENQVIRERFEYIKDQTSHHSNQEPLQYEDQVRSLTETDFHFSPNNNSQQSFKLNDSTISVNEQTKKKIKEKVQKYKENHNRRRSMQHSQHNSFKRSQTHDYQSRNASSRGTSKKTTKRQVRFSENKKASRSKERDALSAKKSHDLMAQELLELRKNNAYLKLELDKARKKQEIKEDYYEKWRELKLKYKELESNYKEQAAKKKDQKHLIEEQKNDIKKLKKKVKAQKDKIKKLKGETPSASTTTEIHDKQKVVSRQAAKSYKQFKNEELEIKQKSHRKIQPSDVIRAKSKQKIIKRI